MVRYIFETIFKAKHFEIVSFSFFCQTFRNIEELEAKIYFTDHQTVKKIQLFVANKRKFFTSILLNNLAKGKSSE